MVEKKISIKVDGANNQLTLVVGDFVNIDELEENLETQKQNDIFSLNSVKYLQVPFSRDVETSWSNYLDVYPTNRQPYHRVWYNTLASSQSSYYGYLTDILESYKS